ncbi:telomerase Cajal body protein 1-like [Ctenocephalides felis]|uniref:telomerase Cajal body protein 1-like n=1 Tax=Ctenocephalides felis TaxID=7515 RepID=UPI000E6E2D69|nr:telomerase Cajal body protein 1-like [Ctenocephalides felis]
MDDELSQNDRSDNTVEQNDVPVIISKEQIDFKNNLSLVNENQGNTEFSSGLNLQNNQASNRELCETSQQAPCITTDSSSLNRNLHGLAKNEMSTVCLGLTNPQDCSIKIQNPQACDNNTQSIDINSSKVHENVILSCSPTSPKNQELSENICDDSIMETQIQENVETTVNENSEQLTNVDNNTICSKIHAKATLSTTSIIDNDTASKFNIENSLNNNEKSHNSEESIQNNIESIETDLQNEQQNNIEEAMEITESSYDILTNKYFSDKIIELSRLATNTTISNQNYFRGCKWSPDGTCILSIINNKGMQVTELPRELYSNENVSTERPVDILTPALRIKEAGLVYDFEWYPKMNSYDPATCCWITSIQHGPVQLWDAFDGSLRSSYRGYNDVDEVEAALCTRFSPNGDNIFAGYKKSIKLFDTDRPGRDYLNFRIKQPASCLALNSFGNLLAVGSWHRTVTLMSVNSGDLIQFDTIYGHKGGITHLMFMDDSSNSTNYLLSGARMDPTLFLWDIRQTMKPVRTFCRQVISNQRIYFDLSPFNNNWLVSASTSGLLRVWNLKTEKEFKFPVHNDCCNGVSFHPSRPIIATTSGQYHFAQEDTLNDDESKKNSQGDNNESILEDNMQTCKKTENSMVFWWVSDITGSTNNDLEI